MYFMYSGFTALKGSHKMCRPTWQQYTYLIHNNHKTNTLWMQNSSVNTGHNPVFIHFWIIGKILLKGFIALFITFCNKKKGVVICLWFQKTIQFNLIVLQAATDTNQWPGKRILTWKWDAFLCHLKNPFQTSTFSSIRPQFEAFLHPQDPHFPFFLNM